MSLAGHMQTHARTPLQIADHAKQISTSTRMRRAKTLTAVLPKPSFLEAAAPGRMNDM